MQSSELRYPVLRVSIGGSAVERRPSVFRLVTDQGVPAVMARLSYPADVESGASGEDITVSLIADAEEHLLFTGEICDAKTRGAYRDLALTDGYRKLCDSFVTPAYRKEKAPVILQDALDAAGIRDTKITCPELTLHRFSTERISADRCVRLLVHALSGFGETGIRYFFDAGNVFRFGKNEDTGRNGGPEITLETGKNIIERGEGWVEILPAPIRHSQKVTVDGAALETVRTELIVSRRSSRLVLWLKGAA
jgi:hypothetical protein